MLPLLAESSCPLQQCLQRCPGCWPSLQGRDCVRPCGRGCSLSLRKLSDSSPDLPPHLPQAGQSRANQFCGQQSGMLLIGLILSDLEILLILPGMQLCSTLPERALLSMEPVQCSSLGFLARSLSLSKPRVRHSCWLAVCAAEPPGTLLHWETELQ